MNRRKDFKGSSKQSGAVWQKLEAWTALFNHLASSERANVYDHLKTYRNNPGGAIKALYRAWSRATSLDARSGSKGGRGNTEGGRQQLASILKNMYESDKSPVPSLFKKLAGEIPISVRDAIRIVSAFLLEWPGGNLQPVATASRKRAKAKVARELADKFVRQLLHPLNERSADWDLDELETRVFILLDEERIGARRFVHEAGKEEGALIVAGSRNVLVGTSPIDTMRQFHELTSQFVGQDNKGILIFVLDAGILEAGDSRFELLQNIGLLSSALTAFALFPSDDEATRALEVSHVDWTRWRAISGRCCLVMRRPPLVDPASGKPLLRKAFDQFINSWNPPLAFERLPQPRGFVPFDASHLLPAYLPLKSVDIQALSGSDLYWDVLIRGDAAEADSLSVRYFVPPSQRLLPVAEPLQSPEFGEPDVPSDSRLRSVRGRPPLPAQLIEEDSFYVKSVASPGKKYDQAQKAIYRAARGRLKLDNGATHQENLHAAAVLRELGFEVLPVAIALSILPRALFFASTKAAEPAVT